MAQATKSVLQQSTRFDYVQLVCPGKEGLRRHSPVQRRVGQVMRRGRAMGRLPKVCAHSTAWVYRILWLCGRPYGAHLLACCTVVLAFLMHHVHMKRNRGKVQRWLLHVSESRRKRCLAPGMADHAQSLLLASDQLEVSDCQSSIDRVQTGQPMQGDLGHEM